MREKNHVAEILYVCNPVSKQVVDILLTNISLPTTLIGLQFYGVIYIHDSYIPPFHISLHHGKHQLFESTA